MRTPESYLKKIERLRSEHSANERANRWESNDAVRRKIIAEWEGYHQSISKQLDRLGVATTVGDRIESLAKARDFFYAKLEKS
jgi:hypothetical protein